MAIPTSYLTSTRNVSGILEQIQRGGIPQKFNYEHLKEMGFKSSADRPIIPILKALGFLNESGVPTERYRRYKEKAKGEVVLAEGIREGYADVFRIDEGAPTLSADEVKGIFSRLSGKSDAVAEKMAKTFRALAADADFAQAEQKQPEPEAVPSPEAEPEPSPQRLEAVAIHHDVHVHLPVSTDIKVYDAIFRSLREHLTG